MEYCYECGAAAPEIDGWPTCSVHGRRWKLRRNAPCADVVIERDGAVLLARRAAEPFAATWDLIGGYCDLGEHPRSTAIREVREELAVTLHVVRLLGVFVYPWAEDVCLTTTYLGTIDGLPSPDPSEISELEWLRSASLPEPDDLAPGVADKLRAWRGTT